MTPSDLHHHVQGRASSPALTRAAVLALGCMLASCSRPAATSPSPSFPKRDGPEHTLGIQWEESLDAAMERGRREKKPVLIAFSARRQERDFEGEF